MPLDLGFLTLPALFADTPVARLTAGFACLFFVLVVSFSTKFVRDLGPGRQFKYYLCCLLTLLCTVGVIFADNLMLLFTLWGFLGLLLYLMIGFGTRQGTPEAARKALVIVGGTDALMLFGIIAVWLLTFGASAGIDSLFGMRISELEVPLRGEAAVAAYLCIAAAALAKSGAMPFHTWVPDTAENAPVPVAAFLPASLDKLLGIFMLARISVEVFVMTPAMNTILMAIGSLTIVAAVMMAMVQHDLKRLLGYHAVSQVGYMVLGIGTGNPIGIAGGLFHMFNNAVYKSGLFLAGGVVEKRTGTTDLEKLGGLAKTMPLVFLAFVIASLSISGVPPFNGFASKWLIYQGILASSAGSDWLRILWLTAAMFGSALTLASFMKLIHAIFLGQPSAVVGAALSQRPGKTGFAMGMPLAVLSLLCVGLGVAAWKLPLGSLLRPLPGGDPTAPGLWSSGLVTVMIVAGFLVGLLVYEWGRAGRTRSTEPFVGGETVADFPEMRVSGVEFYATVSGMPFLRAMYRAAEKKLFDLYDIGLRLLGWTGEVLSDLHDGLLGRYVLWVFAGLVLLYFVLM